MRQVASGYVEPYGTRVDARGCTLKRRGLCWWELRVPSEALPVFVLATWGAGESIVTEDGPGVYQIHSLSEDKSAPESVLKVKVWTK